MPMDIFPQPPTPQLVETRKRLSPDMHDAFAAFSESVFAMVRCRQDQAADGCRRSHITQRPNCSVVIQKRRCGRGSRLKRS